MTDSGEYTGPKTLGDVTVTLTGCELNKIQYHNTATAGEIKLNALKGEIGYFDETFAKPHARGVGLDLTPETGSYLAGGIEGSTLKERWSGSVIAEVAPPYNEFRKELKLRFERSSAKQAIQSLEGMPNDTPLTETWNGFEWNPGAETAWSGEILNQGEELELKA